MKIKNVKSWLEESKQQFIIKDRYANGGIRVVQRIKDDAVFHIGPQRCVSYLKFIEFCDDLIHAKIICHSKTGPCEVDERKILKCEVNNIKLNESGSEVIGWEGVTI